MTVTSPPASPATRSGVGASLRAALAKPLAPYYLDPGQHRDAHRARSGHGAVRVQRRVVRRQRVLVGDRAAPGDVGGHRHSGARGGQSAARPSWFRRLAVPILVLSIVLLVLVLVPGIGVSVNGNQNWIEVGGSFRIQPAEAAKFALVLWGADLLTRKRKLLHQNQHLLIPLLPVAAVVIGLVLLGGDLGTSLILMAIVAGMLFVAGAPLRRLRRARRARRWRSSSS